jgi:glutamate racemase
MALETLQEVVDIPVVGVIEPGAKAAVQAAKQRCIAVIGTEATINSQAYHRAIWQVDPKARIVAKACPLLVSMVEEGREPTERAVELVVEEYLQGLKEHEPSVLLLGCTHYPLLREAFAKVMGPEVDLIDSAYHTAKQVAEVSGKPSTERTKAAGSVRCYVSDNAERFATLGTRFLNEPLGYVSYVPLDALIADPGSALGVTADAKEAPRHVG